MLRGLPLSLLHLLVLTASPAAVFASNISPARSLLDPVGLGALTEKQLTSRDVDPNGTTFLWLLQDTYAGSTFFDGFDFFTDKDPTNGRVTYVNATDAWAKNLVSIQNDSKVIMKGDDTNWLPQGAYRDSVRISSKKIINSGSLLILDIDKAPWGCAVWPAFWTVGSNWPWNGEIDIIEGVHDNEHNQVTWHTAPGCNLTTPASNFTGTLEAQTCDTEVNSNAGCAIIDWSRASYGPYFDQQGGGVFAMKWDENSISAWSFYRAAIPADITAGSPSPSEWGTPTAMLTQDNCNFSQFFANHTIVFDITFCGDWAGNSYPASCPGTCPDRLVDPSNFVNATWIINSLKVFNKQLLSAPVHRGSAGRSVATTGWITVVIVAIALLLV